MFDPKRAREIADRIEVYGTIWPCGVERPEIAAMLRAAAEIIEKPTYTTSAETSAVAWPINVMDGAEWNILDATGTRIAVCGYDGADQSHPIPNAQDCYGSGRRIGWAIVGMIRTLKTKADFWEREAVRAASSAAKEQT